VLNYRPFFLNINQIVQTGKIFIRQTEYLNYFTKQKQSQQQKTFLSVIQNILLFIFSNYLKFTIMKKMNLVLGVALLFSIALVSSSFTNPLVENKKVAIVDECTNLNTNEDAASNQGNGNVVTIDNGQTWIWIADNCIAPWVPATSTRVQTATNGLLNVTSTFQLPEGHCDIPAIGAKVVHYSEDSWAIINSNGKVVAKIVYNPN